MLKKIEWPGIATAVGIVLILTLIIVGSRDDFHLKDWQPFMAAVVALGGGAMAYWGAMAKVYADQDRDRRELDRKRMGLYLRLLFPMDRMNKRTNDVLKALTGVSHAARRFPPSAIRIDLPEELDEAWKALEMLPFEVSLAIDIIRSELPNGKRLLETYPENSIIEIGQYGVRFGDGLKPYADTCERIADETNKSVRLLRREALRISNAYQ